MALLKFLEGMEKTTNLPDLVIKSVAVIGVKPTYNW